MDTQCLDAKLIKDDADTDKFNVHSLHSSSSFAEGFKDIISGSKLWRVWIYLAFSDIRRRYRRTFLGPFWATLSLSIFAVSVSILYSSLWKTDIRNFMPFFASGFIGWVLISSIISEGCAVFVAAEGVMKQLPLPYFTFVWAAVVRNLFLLMHHFVFYLIVMLLLDVPINLYSVLIIPALGLISLTGLWVVTLVGTICTRYRDMQLAVSSLLQISLFITPIFWRPTDVQGMNAFVFVESNPFYHYLNLIRMPLLGQAPELNSWMMVSILTCFLGVLAILFYCRQYRKLIFFL